MCLHEDESTVSGPAEMTATPVIDFDAELAMFTEESHTGGVIGRPPNIVSANADDLLWEHAGDCVRISCMRVNSADGRKEGWLTGDSGASASQDAGTTSRSGGPPNMEQFSQEAQRILVPDRIWDGIGRRVSAELTGPHQPNQGTRAYTMK